MRRRRAPTYVTAKVSGAGQGRWELRRTHRLNPKYLAVGSHNSPRVPSCIDVVMGTDLRTLGFEPP